MFGRVRVMGIRDRSVCGSTAPRSNQPVDPGIAPILVERLLDRSSSGALAFARMIVAGILPTGVRGVVLDAAGRRAPVAVSRDTRAFLAVLPGSVRRLDLMLVFLRSSGRQVVDFGSGRTGAGAVNPIVKGSLQTPIVISGAGVTPPVALAIYRVREATVHGSLTEPCAEPARLIAGEPGDFNAGWGDFLDAPTLVGLPEFNGSWVPSGPTASSIDSCLNGIDDFGDGPVGGLGVQRVTARLIAVHGFLAPGVTGLQVIAPSGQRSDAIIDSASRAFLVVVSSIGGVGDQLRLTAIGGHPKTRAQTVALGDQRLPQPFRYQLRDRGRIIYVAWDGGGQPFAGADVAQSGESFRVSVLDLFPPAFAADGTPYAIAGIGTYSCANIHVDVPLPSNATIINASTGRRLRPSKLVPGPRRFRCPDVRPGQHVDIPWAKTLR